MKLSSNMKTKTYWIKNICVGCSVVITEINSDFATHYWLTSKDGFHGRRTTKLRVEDEHRTFIQKGNQKHYIDEFQKITFTRGKEQWEKVNIYPH